MLNNQPRLGENSKKRSLHLEEQIEYLLKDDFPQTKTTQTLSNLSAPFATAALRHLLPPNTDILNRVAEYSEPSCHSNSRQDDILSEAVLQEFQDETLGSFQEGNVPVNYSILSPTQCQEDVIEDWCNADAATNLEMGDAMTDSAGDDEGVPLLLL
jgi:hypothetical protein